MDFKKEMALLLVEDDPGDAELARLALEDSGTNIHLTVVVDGIKAMQYLRQELPYDNATRPDLILLDFNLPLKDGSEVLREVKADPGLRSIPVVVFTTSTHEGEINRCYSLGANCCIVKPLELDAYLETIRSVTRFWFAVVKLPQGTYSHGR